MEKDQTACPFCGDATALADDRRESHRPPFAIPPSRFWRQCSRLECRAAGPRCESPEAANLAFLQRP